MRIIDANVEKVLHIGKQGENGVTKIDFGVFLAQCKAEFGAGTVALAHQRAEDEAPYLATVTDGIWTVSSSDVQYAGTGLLELTYTVGSQVKKSMRWKTCTLSALGNTVTPPAAWQSYVDSITGMVNSFTTAEASRVSAENARVLAENARVTAESGRNTRLTNVENQVSSIRRDIGGGPSEYEREEDDVKNGAYIINASNTVYLAAQDGWLTAEPLDVSLIPVGSTVTVKSSLNSKYGVYICDADMKALDYVNGNNASSKGYAASTTPQEIVFTMPTGAKWLVQDFKQNKYTGVALFDVKVSTALITAEIEREVKQLASRIDNLDVHEYAVSVDINEGGYINSKGEVVTNANYCYTDMIDVAPYTSIEFPVLFTSDSVYFSFYKADGMTLVESRTTSDPGHYTEYKGAVPAGAKWMRSSIYHTKTALFSFTGYQNTSEKLYDITSTKAAKWDDEILTDGGMLKIFKTIGVVGDSLSSGAMSEPNEGLSEDQETTTDNTWYSWIQYVSRAAGISGYNFSKGGMSARSLRYEPTNQYVAKILSDLAAYKCRAYFVALGHNDKNYAESHPEYAVDGAYDKAHPDTNSDTFTGNYAWILSKIKTINPAAKIFCITMKIKSRFEEYNAAVRTLAEDFGAYLIDMEDVPLESAWEYSYGHGNAMGYLNYGNQIATYTDWIIRHNRADFKEVQFIPDNPLPTVSELCEDIAELQTDKQDKLTAGENITIVDNVISATGGGGSSTEPQYRLLNTITLTADRVIDVNADSNGTPYNLKKLLIEITCAVTASAMSGMLIVYISDTTDIRFSLSPIAGSAVKKCTCEFEQKNGRWFGTYMQPTNDSNGNTQIGVSTTPNAFGHFAVQDYPKISRFRFGGGTLSKNTVVTVYGVDN